jgi:hypothetical protein
VKRRGGIERYTTNEIDEMLARGENRTDWVAVKRQARRSWRGASPPTPMTFINRSIGRGRSRHATAEAQHSHPRRRGCPRLVRQAGRGRLTRINNVLRAFMKSRKRAPR